MGMRLAWATDIHLDFLADDELLEVTPKSYRLRKRLLSQDDRAKERKRAAAQGRVPEPVLGQKRHRESEVGPHHIHPPQRAGGQHGHSHHQDLRDHDAPKGRCTLVEHLEIDVMRQGIGNGQQQAIGRLGTTDCGRASQAAPAV